MIIVISDKKILIKPCIGKKRVGWLNMKLSGKVAAKILMAVLAAMLVLAGCSGGSPSDGQNNQSSANAGGSAGGSNDTGKSPNESTQSDDAQYPITIKHALGETVIPSKPERVVTISWANHDVALALGVVPVGFSEANYGVEDDSGLLPWTKQKLDELGVSEPNIFRDAAGLDFEAISDAEPDVILAAYSGITQEEYETLSLIAPVVAYPNAPWVISWREQIMMNATGMGLAAEGEQLIKDTEQFIADQASKHPEMKGVKAAFIAMTPGDLSSFWIYMPGDPRGEFLQELGMVFPDSIHPYATPDTGFALQLSAEHADALNEADILITYGDEALLAAMQADPVFSKVPAVKRGSMVLIPDGTPLAASLNPNPLSIRYTTEEYIALIVEAIQNIN
jgi:iron complex transport system substrate-binding protein